MATPKITYYNCKTLPDFFDILEVTKGYLEKATSGDLGDFTENGKVRNAGYNNYTIYWDWYKTLGYGSYQKEPYCAGYVSTMMVSAFGLSKAKKLLCGDLFIYCPIGYNQFKAKGRIHSTPKDGDVIFFWSDSLGRWGHTGFVIGVDANGKGYTTMEANTSCGNDTVVRNGGATCKKHYTIGARKVAFGRPDYVGNDIHLTKENHVPTNCYDLGTGAKGLTCLVDTTLNIRNKPVNGAVVGKLKHGDVVIPTLKTFENGTPWFKITFGNIEGWVSAKYFEGWVQERSDGNKWWYLWKDYKYPTNEIYKIDDKYYFFGADGYMVTGTITFETDENGALIIKK